MIRFISIAVLLFCFLVPGYPLLAAQNSLGMKDPAARDRESLKIVQFMFRLILKIAGVEVTVKGAENIPRTRRSFMWAITEAILIFWWVIRRCRGLWDLWRKKRCSDTRFSAAG